MASKVQSSRVSAYLASPAKCRASLSLSRCVPLATSNKVVAPSQAAIAGKGFALLGSECLYFMSLSFWRSGWYHSHCIRPGSPAPMQLPTFDLFSRHLSRLVATLSGGGAPGVDSSSLATTRCAAGGLFF